MTLTAQMAFLGALSLNRPLNRPRVIYMLTLHARTIEPLCSARLPTSINDAVQIPKNETVHLEIECG